MAKPPKPGTAKPPKPAAAKPPKPGTAKAPRPAAAKPPKPDVAKPPRSGTAEPLIEPGLGAQGATTRGPVFVRRPDSSRRRMWMLALITVVALVPIGVGLAVSQLVGTASAPPTGPARPPTVTVASSKGSVRVQPGPYDWTSGTHHTAGGRVAQSSEPLLHLSPNGTLTFNFSGKAVPASVGLGLKGTASITGVAPSNPLQLSFRKPAGTYSVVVSTTWSQGQADYYVRVEVT